MRGETRDAPTREEATGKGENEDMQPIENAEIRADQDDIIEVTTASQEGLYVRDVMNSNVISIGPDESLKTGAQRMSENHITCLPVVEKGSFLGLVTQKTVLQTIIQGSAQADDLLIRDHMSRSVPTISPDFSVLEASQVAYRKQVKWLPVLEGQTVVGIITQTDLVQALMCFDSFPDVASIMSRDPVAVHAAVSVAEVAKTMAEQGVSCIVAIQNERVIGILTERDLLKMAFKPTQSLSEICVVDAMSFPVITARPSDSMISASRLMDRMHIHHLVVMEDDRLCGIITHTDVLKAFQRSLVQYTGLYNLVKLSHSQEDHSSIASLT